MMPLLSGLGVTIAAPKPNCYRVFASLMNGWRPRPRTVIIGQYKDEPIPSFRAIGLHKTERPVYDCLGERLKNAKADVRRQLKAGVVCTDSIEHRDELQALMRERKT